MRNTCKKAGIIYGRKFEGGFTFHDLRRTFFTHMRRSGVQESVIMEITGHSRTQVVDRYNQVSIEDMREALARLKEYRKGQSASVDQNVDQVQIMMQN
jgi:integrase